MSLTSRGMAFKVGHTTSSFCRRSLEMESDGPTWAQSCREINALLSWIINQLISKLTIFIYNKIKLTYTLFPWYKKNPPVSQILALVRRQWWWWWCHGCGWWRSNRCPEIQGLCSGCWSIIQGPCYRCTGMNDSVRSRWVGGRKISSRTTSATTSFDTSARDYATTQASASRRICHLFRKRICNITVLTN